MDKRVFKIQPSRHVRTLRPPAGLGLHPIIPSDYFITTGEAVMKASQLSIEIEEQQLFLGATPGRYLTYCTELFLAHHEADQFIARLVKIRGPAVHLECWSDRGYVRAMRKNPRCVGRGLDDDNEVDDDAEEDEDALEPVEEPQESRRPQEPQGRPILVERPGLHLEPEPPRLLPTPRAKLNFEKAVEIHRLAKTTNLCELARIMGITRTSVVQVLRGKSYRGSLEASLSADPLPSWSNPYESIMSFEIAVAIHRLPATLSNNTIAAQFGVSTIAVGNVRCGRTYKGSKEKAHEHTKPSIS